MVADTGALPRPIDAALRGHAPWPLLAARAVVVDPDGKRAVVARGYNARVR